LGVKIFEENIPVTTETSKICEFFKVDPLQLISSGALLISVDQDYADKVAGSISDGGIKASIIGEFLTDPERRILIRRDDSETDLVRPPSDHLWLALEKGNRSLGRRKFMARAPRHHSLHRSLEPNR